MANQLYADFKNRGFMLVHVIIEDGTGDGKIDYKDAEKWAFYSDFTGDGNPDPLNFLVIADTDGWLWSNLSGCPIATPLAEQIWDKGSVIVQDTCQYPCQGNCNVDDARVRTKLNQILPPEWCGEATP